MIRENRVVRVLIWVIGFEMGWIFMQGGCSRETVCKPRVIATCEP